MRLKRRSVLSAGAIMGAALLRSPRGLAQIRSMPTLPLLGTNVSGLEFSGPGGDGTGATLPGVGWTDYALPQHAEAAHWRSVGFTTLRLPYVIERLQPKQSGAFDPTYQGYITDFVNYATSLGLYVALDPHNFGYAYGSAILGTTDQPYLDHMFRLAALFATNDHVMFGLMNEPHVQTAAQLIPVWNSAIAAIRAAGAKTQPILVPGTSWTDAWQWVSSGSIAIPPAMVDPNKNLIYEVHQYLDADGIGTDWSPITDPQIGVMRLTQITQWASANNVTLFLGEFGAAGDPQSLTALNNMLAYMAANSQVWVGGTIWSSGPWWWGPKVSPWSIEPGDSATYSDGRCTGTEMPQVAVLRKYVTGGG